MTLFLRDMTCPGYGMAKRDIKGLCRSSGEHSKSHVVPVPLLLCTQLEPVSRGVQGAIPCRCLVPLPVNVAKDQG